METKSAPGKADYRLPAGTMLKDRYRIDDVLGQGGFGITYDGFDTLLNMRVAVKEYYPRDIAARYVTESADVIVDPGNEAAMDHGRKRFLEEARSLAKFAKEPNIVTVRDFFEQNGTAYIIMEYVEGLNLRQCLEKRGMYSFREAWEILRPAACVLSRLHAENVAHRDISPANILIDADGVVKLIDFGAAREFDTAESMSVIVKPGYTALEQYNSKGSQGPWSDVYSLTATLYTMVTGSTPENALDRSFGALNEPASHFNPQITEAEDEAIARGMAVQAKDRIQSMDELIRTMDPLAGRTDSSGAHVPSSENKAANRDGGKSAGRDDEKNAGEDSEKNAGSDAGHDEGSGDEYATLMISGGTDGKNDSASAKSPEAGASLRPGRISAERPERPEYPAPGGPERPEYPAPGGPERPEYRAPERPERPEYHAHEEAKNPDPGTPQDQEPAPGNDGSAAPGVKDSSSEGLSSKNRSSKARVRTGQRRVRPLLIGGAVVAAAILLTVIYLFAGSHMTSKYTNGNGSARLTDVTVTKSMLDSIDRDKTAVELNFSNCEISDEMIRRIGSMKRIKKISLYNCSGFTSLTPLAGLQTLENLQLQGGLKMPSFDPDSFFTDTFGSVTRLALVDYDLQGRSDYLKYFPGVIDLEISGVKNPGDLRSLSKLAALESFCAMKTDLSAVDMGVFSGCSQLSSVRLLNCGVSDISSWSSLTKLKTVIITDGLLTDLSGLSGCTGTLSSLDVSGNQISSLGTLSAHASLKSLNVSNNRLTSLAGIENAVDLREISASHNQITDISALVGHASLWKVYLGDNQITDLTPLADSARLEYIDVCSNRLTSLAGLENAQDLKTLTADSNQIGSLDGIVNSAMIEKAFLGHNLISDISPLAKCALHLQSLWLSDNRVSDISCLSGMSALKNLIIDGNSIADISPLSGDTALEVLALDNNGLSDISVVSELTSLTVLSAGGNHITDISAVSSLPMLNYLDLSYNEITDASPAGDISPKKLALILCNNHIQEIPDLSPSTDYEYLSLYGNPIGDFSGLASSESKWNDKLGVKQSDHLLVRRTISVTWFDGMNPDDILPMRSGSGQGKTTIVDCPTDRQAEIRSRFKEQNNGGPMDPRFLTKEEADEDLAARKAEVFSSNNIKAGVYRLSAN